LAFRQADVDGVDVPVPGLGDIVARVDDNRILGQGGEPGGKVGTLFSGMAAITTSALAVTWVRGTGVARVRAATPVSV
jgi:hypothetical protein